MQKSTFKAANFLTIARQLTSEGFFATSYSTGWLCDGLAICTYWSEVCKILSRSNPCIRWYESFSRTVILFYRLSTSIQGNL